MTTSTRAVPADGTAATGTAATGTAATGTGETDAAAVGVVSSTDLDETVEGIAPVGETATQAQVVQEIRAFHRRRAPHLNHPGHQPERDFPPYRSSALRHPRRPLVLVPDARVELAGPVFGAADVSDLDADLTTMHRGEPLGERIVVTGQVRDRSGRPVRGQLVEIWQANASGRYVHRRDQHPAPLDPNFTGTGRCLTDDEGRYRFVTIKPGAYPWRNHRNAWRPAHIHFSLFGTAFTQRLVTQMYFPGDPLFPLDPIYNSVLDEKARGRLVAAYDHDVTTPEWALGYRWDVVLDGPAATWREDSR